MGTYSVGHIKKRIKMGRFFWRHIQILCWCKSSQISWTWLIVSQEPTQNSLSLAQKRLAIFIFLPIDCIHVSWIFKGNKQSWNWQTVYLKDRMWANKDFVIIFFFLITEDEIQWVRSSYRVLKHSIHFTASLCHAFVTCLS